MRLCSRLSTKCPACSLKTTDFQLPEYLTVLAAYELRMLVCGSVPMIVYVAECCIVVWNSVVALTDSVVANKWKEFQSRNSTIAFIASASNVLAGCK